MNCRVPLSGLSLVVLVCSCAVERPGPLSDEVADLPETSTQAEPCCDDAEAPTNCFEGALCCDDGSWTCGPGLGGDDPCDRGSVCSEDSFLVGQWVGDIQCPSQPSACLALEHQIDELSFDDGTVFLRSSLQEIEIWQITALSTTDGSVTFSAVGDLAVDGVMGAEFALEGTADSLGGPMTSVLSSAACTCFAALSR